MFKFIPKSAYYSQIIPKYVCQITIFVRVFKQVTALLELWTQVDCSIRVSRSFSCLHCFGSKSKRFLHYTTTKTYNFVPSILRIHPIIPEYSPMLFSTYYSRSYAGIMDACLTVLLLILKYFVEYLYVLEYFKYCKNCT